MTGFHHLTFARPHTVMDDLGAAAAQPCMENPFMAHTMPELRHLTGTGSDRWFGCLYDAPAERLEAVLRSWGGAAPGVRLEYRDGVPVAIGQWAGIWLEVGACICDVPAPTPRVAVEDHNSGPGRVLCAHGYVLMQDSCPCCDREQETPHEADPVAVHPRWAKRPLRRCRRCSLVTAHQIHRGGGAS